MAVDGTRSGDSMFVMGLTWGLCVLGIFVAVVLIIWCCARLWERRDAKK